jgi:hypothetical protein
MYTLCMTKHKGIENPEYAKAMAELRRSGASGTHADKREKRARTRGAQLRRAVREQHA